MTRYIYINEDNFAKQSKTEPTPLDMQLARDGLLSIFRIESGAGNTMIEETDGNGWGVIAEAKLLDDEGGNGKYHG